jgi:hypothetical protein
LLRILDDERPRKPARNSAACARPQAAGVKRFIALGGGIAKEGVEARTGFRIGLDLPTRTLFG